MTKRFVAVALLTGGLALACSDGAGPPTELADGESLAVQSTRRSVIPAGEFNPLGWRANEQSREFSGFAMTSDGEILKAPGMGWSLDDGILLSGTMPIETFQVSFWAVKGQTRSVQINYLDSACESGTTYYYDNGYRETALCPYLHFEVRDGSLLARPDGSPIAEGDSVLITVSVDSTQILAHMAPSGLQFDHSDPPVVEMWYAGADHDFNGDGVVDGEDEYIQNNLLGLFTQQGSFDPWTILSSRHSTSMEKFKAFLGHFSGFAVAY
ncbi:MAG: hypothetical protein OER90_01545 [Gemmatimonadota bacterium]|nr:hypothetical protein [Gemmatimonadota bacterium]